MTSYERVTNVLHHRPVDQVPCYDAIWDATVRRWREEGRFAADTDVRDALDMDLHGSSSLNSTANLDHVSETYAQFTIRHLEVWFAEAGWPDGMFFGEDLGFKGKPFLMSDHSIPPQVDFETMQYFFARGRELSRALAMR